MYVVVYYDYGPDDDIIICAVCGPLSSKEQAHNYTNKEYDFCFGSDIQQLETEERS